MSITLWDIVQFMAWWIWLAFGFGIAFGEMVKRGRVRRATRRRG